MFLLFWFTFNLNIYEIRHYEIVRGLERVKIRLLLKKLNLDELIESSTFQQIRRFEDAEAH